MHNEGDPRVTEDLLALANGPSKWCSRYKSYVSNGFRFKVRNGLEDGKRQNWGVWLQAEMSSYATANDCNHREGMVGFYGALVDIIELQYRGDRNIVLFKCDWPEVNSRGGGVKKDEYGFTLVNFNKCMGPEDPYVFASHAIQAMFVKDPTDVEWHVAIKTRPRDFFDMSSTPIEDPCSRQDLEHVTCDDDHLPIRTDVRNRKD
ncbi:hypothetical protein RchiOBHm_Chr2g0136591 [Rosa chinensis]|uniref:DUF4216 domain-containing protein n=1 Tax=Rosa chinensis TaxID=74649 RepID=A0A2P6RWD7_ROSCH|nr:hypothetical protein RchiOBHm_Chr2g0136591 [Rosa chinensis]